VGFVISCQTFVPGRQRPSRPIEKGQPQKNLGHSPSSAAARQICDRRQACVGNPPNGRLRKLIGGRGACRCCDGATRPLPLALGHFDVGADGPKSGRQSGPGAKADHRAAGAEARRDPSLISATCQHRRRAVARAFRRSNHQATLRQ
jgi:hypothetical protein